MAHNYSGRNVIANKQKNCNYRPQPVTISGQKIVLVERDSTEALIKHTATTDENLFLVARNTRTLTCIARTFITLHANETVYFVVTGRAGWYYLVNGNAAEVTAPCTCLNGLAGEQCQHTDDVASYEARCREQEAEQAPCLDMEWYELEVAECTAAVRSMHRHEAEKIARIAESVGVPVSEVALIAALAQSATRAYEAEARTTGKPIDPVQEASAFIARVLKEKARNGTGCAA